jgi:hypothetical protein
MDDTLWLSKSKHDLNNIMLIADSFYHLNDIKVNWDKSVLVTSFPIQNRVNFELTNGNIWLQPSDPKIPIRYLGIWISISQNKKFIRQQVQEEIANSANIMKRKSLTDKHLVAIFNMVIILRVLYKIQTTYLTANFCDMIMGTFRKTFKKALHLSISTPQAVIHSSKIFNLAHLYDHQLQAKISNLQKMTNDPGLLGITSKIRTIQLQIKEWLPSSPFNSWPFQSPALFNDWWSSILTSMSSLDLSFATNDLNANVIQGGLKPILELINPLAA